MKFKKVSYFCFAFFSIFYLFTASRVNIPGVTILRWIGSILLIGCSIFLDEKSKKDSLKFKIPKSYGFLFLAMIPTFFGISGHAIVYAYERIISLFLLLLALEEFFKMKIWTNKDYLNFLRIYTCICFLLMIYSTIFPNYQIGRMTGAYENANFLSCIASFSFIASISLLIYEDSKLKRMIWFLNCVLSGYCIIQSGSRIGLAILVITIFLSLIIYNIKLTSKTILILIIALFFTIIIIILIYRYIDIPALARFTSSGSGNAFDRGDTWKDVFIIFRKKPLLGWGYGTVGYNVFINTNHQYEWGMHSSYFIILCEMGILGSICFIAFFNTYYINMYLDYVLIKKHISDKEVRITKFLVLITFMLLVNAYSESFLFSVGNPMAVCFWFPLILSYNRLKKYRHILKKEVN